MTEFGSQPQSDPVRAYDFRRPERLTASVRDELRADQKALGRELGDCLAEILRAECGFEFEEAQEDSSDGVFEAPRDPVFALALASSDERVLFGIEASLAQAFVDRLLGGGGATREVDRKPTEVEAALLGLAAEKIGDVLARAWGLGEGKVGRPIFLTAADRSEMPAQGGIASSFSLSIGEAEGRLRFFYPYGALARILGVEMREDARQGGQSETGERLTPERIGGMRLGVRAQFPATPIQIRDINSLQVGDVLYLDRKPDDEIEISIGDRVVFFGHPGAAGDVLGVQISRTL